MQGFLVENARILPALPPKDTTGAAANGDWIKLTYYRKVAIIIQQGAWAGGTPAVTLEQAKTNAGGSSKALSFQRYFTLTGLTQDTLTEVAVTSDTFNLTTTANTQTIIEVRAQDLDTNNGFTYLRVSIASPGANADLIYIGYILYDADYAGKPSTMPSVIA